ncbi:MAG: hypothetical protein WD030_10780 [Pirellulales bacterium]
MNHGTIHDVAEWLDSAQVFFGELSAAEARVYVELDRVDAFADVALQGQVVGPHSDYSHTLKTTVPLRELPPGETRLAAAFMPDPCFWTPLLPFVYTLDISAIRDDVQVAVGTLAFGLRPLGVRGDDLFFDSKRIALRCVDETLVTELSIEAFRETSTALLVRTADDELLETCTRHGILAVVELPVDLATAPAALERLGRHVSAGIALLRPEAFTESLLRRKPRNLLLAALVTDPAAAPPEADLIAQVADSPQTFSSTWHDMAKPILAVLNSRESAPVEELRRQCDALQAALAGHGRLAGYVIRNGDARPLRGATN